MRISTFLPNTGVFGGVRRFLELGNAWVAQGHEVVLYTPGGRAPGWLPYRGAVRDVGAAAATDGDLAVCADPHTFDAFRRHAAGTHLYYCVLERDPGLARAIADRDVVLAANSGTLRRAVAGRAGRAVLDGAGGINTSQFRPAPSQRTGGPLRLLVNGRRSRPKKGTDLVLRAAAGLTGRVPPFEVVLFDTPGPGDPDPRDGAPLPANARWILGPTQDELVRLYQSADVFVAAERKAGWCNTALEALACGAALVCTRSGTRDFARHEATALVVPVRHPYFVRRALRRVLTDDALRERLAAAGPEAAAPWSWERLAARILEQIRERAAPGSPRPAGA